jgi:hypothetical protein
MALKLPDNHFAKIKLTAYSGEYDDRTITIRWAYQPILNYPKFSPPGR